MRVRGGGTYIGDEGGEKIEVDEYKNGGKIGGNLGNYVKTLTCNWGWGGDYL